MKIQSYCCPNCQVACQACKIKSRDGKVNKDLNPHVCDREGMTGCDCYCHKEPLAKLVTSWEEKNHELTGEDWECIWEIADLIPFGLKANARIALAAFFLAIKGQYDGNHHKQWTIDQSLRILLDEKYFGMLGASRDLGVEP